MSAIEDDDNENGDFIQLEMPSLHRRRNLLPLNILRSSLLTVVPPRLHVYIPMNFWHGSLMYFFSQRPSFTEADSSSTTSSDAVSEIVHSDKGVPSFIKMSHNIVNNDPCPVCLETFKEGFETKLKVCNHKLCLPCSQKLHSRSCPICRSVF